jgi:hypothetical protein
MAKTYARLKVIKDLLSMEHQVNSLGWRPMTPSERGPTPVEVLPILSNSGMVILQFNGWSINLYDDGSYIMEATDGG